MFGLLSPKTQTREYRHAYSQVCREHHATHGKLAVPFHSYESVLLYLLASDLGYCPTSKPTELCCRLRPAAEPPSEHALAASRFSANFSLLLAWVKLTDDVTDDRSYRARLLLRLMKSRLGQMFVYFERIDPDFRKAIHTTLSRHAELERSGCCSLDHFAAPTADSFAYLFELYAIALNLRDHTAWLQKVGALLGAAIICFDVAADYHADQRRHSFNPLSSHADIPAAVNRAKRLLSDAANICEAHCPNGTSAGVLRSIDASISVTEDGRASKIKDWLGEANPWTGYRRGYLYSSCCDDPSFCGPACLLCCCLSSIFKNDSYTVTQKPCGGGIEVKKKSGC